MLSLSVSCIHLELSPAKSPKEQALVLSNDSFSARQKKMTELCGASWKLDYAFVKFPQFSSRRAFPGFSTASSTLPIRLHIPDGLREPPGSTQHQMQKLQKDGWRPQVSP